MTKFLSLDDDTTVPGILKKSPAASISLMDLHEHIMRGPSSLSLGEREMIAAHVSRINGCTYCYGIHSKTAIAYGIPAKNVKEGADDPDTGEIDAKLRPLINYSRKLTKGPASMTEEDAQAVYAMGWDEQALHETIMVTSLFNFMNRLLEGHGVYGNEAMYKKRSAMLKEFGYAALNR